jgi:hypothetical protein
LKEPPKSRGITRVIAYETIFVPSRLLLSLSDEPITRAVPTNHETPFLQAQK